MKPKIINLKNIFLILFFLSGACALTYQVIWVRMLNQIFGVNAFAVATVLGAFMAGLALGNHYFGKLADRHSQPLKLFAYLQFFIGLFALCSPLFFSLITNFYVALHKQFYSNFYTFSLIRFVLPFLLLILPTALMGGTLPVLSKFYNNNINRLGRDVGIIYSVNNFGAVAGCFAASFFLIITLGVSGTLYFAAVINILISLATWILCRNSINQKEDSPQKNIAAENEENTSAYSKHLIRLLLSLFLLEGFISMAYEVIWIRMLSASVLVNSVYSFSLVVIIFILGLSLGGFIVSRLIDVKKDLFRLFGVIEILTGLFALLLLALFSSMPSIQGWLREGMSGSHWTHKVFMEFSFSFVLMFIPATLMGMFFPLVIKIYTNNLKNSGTRIGNAGFMNTAGSIFGSIAGGFILIPLFGMYRSVFYLTILNVLSGIIILVFSPGNSKRRLLIPAGLTALYFITVFLIPSGAKYWRNVSSSGEAFNDKLIYYKEDYAATISVVQVETGEGLMKFMEVNGVDVAGTTFMLKSTQKVQAHLPLLLFEAQNNKTAPNALIVGLGSGGTSWSASLHDIGEIICVELVPGVLEAASAMFKDVNHDVFKNPLFKTIIDDGKNYLLATDKKFSVILTESVHPVYSGNASLYSRDYFQLCRKRLSEDGLISVWLPLWRLGTDDFKMVLKTFQSVFPYATIWYTDNCINKQVCLIGTMKELKIDFSCWQKRVNDTKIKNDLKEIYLDDPLKLLDAYIMSPDDIKTYSNSALVYTEEKPYLEFLAPRSYDSDVQSWRRNIAGILKYKKSALSLLSNYKPYSKQEISERLSKYDSASKHALMGIISQDENPEVSIRQYRLGISLNPDDKTIGYLLYSMREDYLYSFVRRAHYYHENKSYNKAIEFYNEALKIAPDNIYILNDLGLCYNDKGMPEKAEELLLKALRLDTARAVSHNNLGIVYIDEMKYDNAIIEFGNALKINPEYQEAYNNRGIAYKEKGELDSAIADYNKALELNKDCVETYINRGIVYNKKELYEKAILDFSYAIRLDPKARAAYEYRSIAYTNSGRHDLALKDKKKASALLKN